MSVLQTGPLSPKTVYFVLQLSDSWVHFSTALGLIGLTGNYHFYRNKETPNPNSEYNKGLFLACVIRSLRLWSAGLPTHPNIYSF